MSRLHRTGTSNLGWDGNLSNEDQSRGIQASSLQPKRGFWFAQCKGTPRGWGPYFIWMLSTSVVRRIATLYNQEPIFKHEYRSHL